MRRTLLVTLMGGWLLAGCATARPAGAGPGVPTKVVVHVASSDAKLIGAQVGGAKVTLRDAATGEVLAEGLHTGGSGDTKKIMVEPHRRGEALYDTEGAASFTATLMLAEPTVVEVSAEGPLEPPAATRRASTTVLLVPGKDLTGDGVVLTIHGLRVELLAPAEAAALKADEPVPVRALLTMA